MIIDCDTHFMPRDAFDYLAPSLSDRKLVLKFDEQGLLVDIEFGGKPSQVSGTTPLPAPGSGAHHPGNTDMKTRLKDYERMGKGGLKYIGLTTWRSCVKNRTG